MTEFSSLSQDNSTDSAVTPDLGMASQMFFQLVLRRELFAAGLAGVRLRSTEFLPVFLQMQRELTLQDELVSTLRAQEVLTTQTDTAAKESASRH